MKGSVKMNLKGMGQSIKKIMKIKGKGLKRNMPVMEVGVNRKAVKVLWALLAISVFFGIYKNFTAAEVHTVHEKEIIEEKLIDTNAIENFVINFAEIYYTWSNNNESIEQRIKALKDYLTTSLQTLNEDTVRSDIPTSSEVKDVSIWQIESKENCEYDVTYSVEQLITEGENQKVCSSFYCTRVYQDENANLVIVRNPTVSEKVEKSSYEPQEQKNDASVNGDQRSEIEDFLNTFFKLYPTAEEKELAYYVKNEALKPIQMEKYIYSALNIVSCSEEEEGMRVSVIVEYLDEQTKAVQKSQYELMLKKGENWMIARSD